MKRTIILLALSFCAFSAPRTEIVKIARADTTKVITYDTLIVTKIFKDTSVLVKVDTTDPKKVIKKVK